MGQLDNALGFTNQIQADFGADTDAFGAPLVINNFDFERIDDVFGNELVVANTDQLALDVYGNELVINNLDFFETSTFGSALTMSAHGLCLVNILSGVERSILSGTLRSTLNC